MRFEPADLALKMGFKKTNVQFRILLQTAEQITLVAETNTNVAQMYSIFPKQGIGYFSIHSYKPVQNGEAISGSLTAKCSVQASSSKK